MRSVKAHIINSFTRNGGGGNAAGVVLDAETLTHDQKLEVASQLGLSETAFLLPSSSADLRLEFFTPNKQIPLCGHATIASLALLRGNNAIKVGDLKFESIVGTHPLVAKEKTNGLVLALDSFKVFEKNSKLSDSLGLETPDIIHAWIASAGVRFLVMRVHDQLKLRSITPDYDAITRLSLENDLVGYYIFSGEPTRDKVFEVRMFAPSYGILEESATGMGAAALGVVLNRLNDDQHLEFKVFQGHLMQQPSPSEIQVSVSNGGKHITVTGESTVVAERMISVNSFLP